MAIGVYGPEYLQFDEGGPAAEVRIFVYLPGTTTKAQLYADKSGLYTGPNPVWTDRRGELVFFAEVGAYDLVYADTDTPVTIPIEITGENVIDNDVFVHLQNIASNLWVIEHNLGVRPSVTVEESVGIPFEITYPGIRHVDTNTVELRWGYAASGRATLRR